RGTSSISIDSILVRFISTDIGRKEIEDFGIVNLATPLNKFQIGKRQKTDLKKNRGLWNKIQEQKNELLKEGEAAIFKQTFSKWKECTTKSIAGIYIVKDKRQILYIGESSNI